LLTASASGALPGSALAARFGAVARPTVWASIFYLGDAGLLALLPNCSSLPLAMALAAIVGGLEGAAGVLVITLLQRKGGQSAGRFMSLVLLSAMASYPVGVTLATGMTRATGIRATAAVEGAVLLGT